MSKQVQNFIDDARRFQRCSDHDLAISSLQLAQQEDHHKEHEIEIQKLFSLSYRKIGNYNMALLHINNAINQNAKRNVKAKLFCPEIAGLFCRIAGLFCHDSRANLSLKPVCFGIAIS